MKYLAKVFGLDDFERYCIEAILEQPGKTPKELAGEYGKVLDAEQYFWPESTLMRYFFFWQGDKNNRRLNLDERMAVFLQGDLKGYAPYSLLWERVDPFEEKKDLIGEGPVPVMERFLTEAPSNRPVWFHLYGNRGSGRKSRILEFCRIQGRSLLILDGRILEEENQELLGAALRECRIYGAWLMIRNLSGNWFIPSLHREKLFGWMGEEAGVIFTVGEEGLQLEGYPEAFSWLELELPLPDYAQSCRLWKRAFDELPKEKIPGEESFEGKGFHELCPEEWANKFVFTPGQIKEAVSQSLRCARSEGRSAPKRTDLQRGCYHLLRGGMGKRAIRIPANYTWEELILPTLQKQKLRDACNQAACRKWVYENWGFDKKIAYGKGISVVLAGPPGTGKTMAAQVMACELCLDLYRIELPAVVSKYIGETEKNLEEIFEQAKKSQVILLFDEADVLFSKRTEVRDSNDKYSNMEAAFLLQKMEEYEGITVLATNFLQNFDEAFKRRMKFIIDFPFPDIAQRLQIWKQVFPKETPIEEELDYEFLAQSFELSGSNIKNVALHAAFLAAAENCRVGMRQIVAGVRNEFIKSGKTLTKEQLGQYYMLL